MFISPGYTEAQVLASIEKAVTILSPGFAFGHWDRDDVAQYGRLYVIQRLEKFDPTRPLDNWVFIMVRNSYINLRRDKLRRNDPPCKICHNSGSCQGKGYCKKYTDWLARNNAKANLMRPLDIEYISDEHEARTRTECHMESEVEMEEVYEKIDRELDVELRATYLQMRDGVTVPKSRRLLVMNAVREILKGVVECPSEAV